MTQPQYGFAEWALAVSLRKRGYWSIIKSTVKNDKEKKEWVDKLLGKRGAAWLRRRTHKAFPGDLLVYSSRLKKARFFAEAKLNRDELRANQKCHFKRIHKKLGLRTRLYHVVCPYR